jgi:hypothetical protein
MNTTIRPNLIPSITGRERRQANLLGGSIKACRSESSPVARTAVPF